MLNKGKKRTTRVEQAGPIVDREAMRRHIETKNRRLNQDGRTKVVTSETSSASHPLFANLVNQDSTSNPTLDPTNTTNDSFGPTSLYAESNDSAHSEHTSEQINLTDIDVQSTPLEIVNDQQEVYVAQLSEPEATPQTPSKNLEPTRKSGRYSSKLILLSFIWFAYFKRVGKKTSFKDSVLTTIKSKSKLLIKKAGVGANPQAGVEHAATKKVRTRSGKVFCL